MKPRWMIFMACLATSACIVPPYVDAPGDDDSAEVNHPPRIIPIFPEAHEVFIEQFYECPLDIDATIVDEDDDELAVRWFVDYGEAGSRGLTDPADCQAPCNRTLYIKRTDPRWGSPPAADEFSSHVVELLVSDRGFAENPPPEQLDRLPAEGAGWDLFRWVFRLRRTETECLEPVR